MTVTVVVCVCVRRNHKTSSPPATPATAAAAAGGGGGGDVVEMQENRSYSTVILTSRNEAYSSVFQGPLSATNTTPDYETVH